MVKNERLENLIHKEEIEGENERGKQRLPYLNILSRWMIEQGLGETKKNLIKSYKRQEELEGHDRLHPEETGHIKKKK